MSTPKRKVHVLGTTENALSVLKRTGEHFEEQLGTEPQSPRAVIERLTKLYTPEEIFNLIQAKVAKRKEERHA